MGAASSQIIGLSQSQSQLPQNSTQPEILSRDLSTAADFGAQPTPISLGSSDKGSVGSSEDMSNSEKAAAKNAKGHEGSSGNRTEKKAKQKRDGKKAKKADKAEETVAEVVQDGQVTPTKSADYDMEDPSTQLREDIRRARERDMLAQDTQQRDDVTAEPVAETSKKSKKRKRVDHATEEPAAEEPAADEPAAEEPAAEASTRSKKRKRREGEAPRNVTYKKSRNEVLEEEEDNSPTRRAPPHLSMDDHLAEASKCLQIVQEMDVFRTPEEEELIRKQEKVAAKAATRETHKSKKKVKKWLGNQPVSSQEMCTPNRKQGEAKAGNEDDVSESNQEEERPVVKKTLKARKSMATSGETPNAGPFTAYEIDVVDRAIKELSLKNGLSDVEMREIIQSHKRDKESAGYDDVRETLYSTLTNSLPHRNRRAIIKFCKRKYHNFQRGAWDEEQDQALRDAHARKPGKWKEISEALGRMPEDCRDRWRNAVQYGEGRNKDIWTVDEEEELRHAVAECTEALRESGEITAEQAIPTDRISWVAVSQKMDGKRSRLQCVYKWKKLLRREAQWKRDRVHDSSDEEQHTRPASSQSQIGKKNLRKSLIDSVQGESATKTPQSKKSLEQPGSTAKDRLSQWLPGDKYAMLAELNDAVNEVSLDDQPVFWSYVAEKYADSPWANDDREHLYKSLRKKRRKIQSADQLRNVDFQDNVLFFMASLRDFHGEETIAVTSKPAVRVSKKRARHSTSKRVAPSTGDVEEQSSKIASKNRPTARRRISAQSKKYLSEEMVVESDDDVADGAPEVAEDVEADEDHEPSVELGRGLAMDESYDSPEQVREQSFEGRETSPYPALHAQQDDEDEHVPDSSLHAPEDRDLARGENYSVQYELEDQENEPPSREDQYELLNDYEEDDEDEALDNQENEPPSELDEPEQSFAEDEEDLADNEYEAREDVPYIATPESTNMFRDAEIEDDPEALLYHAAADMESDARSDATPRNSRANQRGPSPELVAASPYKSSFLSQQRHHDTEEIDDGDETASEMSPSAHAARNSQGSAKYRAVNSSFVDEQGHTVIPESDVEEQGDRRDPTLREFSEDTDDYEE